MRREALILAVVAVVAVLSASVLAGLLADRQGGIATTRAQVSALPLAGFHKFAADIQWMLFLQYAGSTPVTTRNVAEYDARIRRIISLDPDFVRIYYEGALMIAPVDRDAALKVLDLGIEHPRISDNWRLPMLAGQLIMRSQWDRFYQNQPMDLAQVEMAREYFRKAMHCPGRRVTALGSFVRVEAVLRQNGRPRDVNELETWYEFWRDNRFRLDGLESGQGRRGFGASASFEDESGEVFDLDARLLALMRRLRDRYPGDAYVAELLAKVKGEVFPNVRFEPATMTPVNLAATFSLAGMVESPRGKRYVMDLHPTRDYLILGIAGRCDRGAATVSVLVDGKPVQGLADLALGDARVLAEAREDNRVRRGQTVELAVAPNGEAGDLWWSLEAVYGN